MNKKTEWIKIGLAMVGGLAAGAALLGIPKCTELKTAAAAREDHQAIEKRIDTIDNANQLEHRDFRQSISENMREILRRLPEAK